MTQLGVLDLLCLRGFDRNARAKLVRHQDPDYDVQDLLRSGWLETYQRYQSRPVFHGLDFVVSFIGDGGTRARFLGVYRVLGHRSSSEVLVPSGSPYPKPGCEPGRWYYDLQRDAAFEEFERRLVIDWGRGRLWHQHLSNKVVLELRPLRELLQPFRDYLDFTLTYRELRELYSNAEANKEWRARLSAVAGVYLVLATTTGAQYVGSASGAEGIWGRWAAYAQNGHGGNTLLQELVATDPGNYPASFSYSVLQILPRTFAREVVLDWERRYKAKLGCRATGLNVN